MRLGNLVLFFLVLSKFNICNAQITTFSNRYDLFNKPQTGGGILPLDTGYLLIGNTDDTSSTQRQGLVIKGLNLLGEEQWTKYYVKPNGGFIVSDVSI